MDIYKNIQKTPNSPRLNSKMIFTSFFIVRSLKIIEDHSEDAENGIFEICQSVPREKT